MADRTKEIIETLKEHGENHGYAYWQGLVVLIGPGAPYAVYPTSFSQAEIHNAFDHGLLQKRRLTGALNIEIYTVKPSK